MQAAAVTHEGRALITSPKAVPANTITMGVGSTTYECCEDIDIQSTAASNTEKCVLNAKVKGRYYRS